MKKNIKSKKTGNGNKKPTQKASRSMATYSRMSPGLREHINMVLDPCAAPLAPSIYSGPTGCVQRFVSTGALQSVTEGATYLCVVPGGFRTVSATLANQGTATTPGYGVGSVPGYSFLQANANGVRVLGACLEVHWNGSELNRAGSLACGVVPASTIRGGVVTNIDNIYTTLPTKERVPSGSCQIVWNPGKTDDVYGPCDTALGISDFDDKNAMVVAFQAPPGFLLAYTYTVIYEWTPRQGLGQPAHSTISRAAPDAVASINSILFTMGFTNRGLRNLASSAVGTVAKYSGAGSAFKVMQGGIRTINSLLP